MTTTAVARPISVRLAHLSLAQPVFWPLVMVGQVTQVKTHARLFREVNKIVQNRRQTARGLAKFTLHMSSVVRNYGLWLFHTTDVSDMDVLTDRMVDDVFTPSMFRAMVAVGFCGIEVLRDPDELEKVYQIFADVYVLS